MKKKWIWIISILLTTVILAVLAAVYLPVWKQMLYEKKIENYYTLFRDEVNAGNYYAEDVSIIELIATPEKYDGKLVRVIGVGNLGHALLHNFKFSRAGFAVDAAFDISPAVIGSVLY